MKRAKYLGYLLSAALVAIPIVSAHQESSRAETEAKIDLASARREIQNFEVIINGVLNESFKNPFGLVQEPKGAYLPGYGHMFSFLVNIHRAVINTPFGKYTRKNPIGPEEKKKRIEDIKDKLIRLLLDQGDGFRQVGNDESVTIVAFFEDRNFPEETSQNRTIVLSATKKNLKEYAKKQDQWEAFKQRMTIVEY
jgi:hypothetical protein